MSNVIHTRNEAEFHELVDSLMPIAADSHKGKNGKLLVIGGGNLFHAPLIWAAEIASRMVDMVHVASAAEENDVLMRWRLKKNFWNGIVIPWKKIDDYIMEDDCVLIGPGMAREEGLSLNERSTATIVNDLLSRFPDTRWVIDGGALQEVDPALLNENMIVTPHQKEWERLLIKSKFESINPHQDIQRYSLEHRGLTILLKGPTDVVVRGEEIVSVEGGNAGMTKGGTGDVLAGLTAALATKNDLFLAAQVGSVVNKRAGDALFDRVGPYFNASDLVLEIPHQLR